MKRTLSDFWTSKPKKCLNSRDTTTTTTTIEGTTHTSDDYQADQPTEPSISVTSNYATTQKNSVTIKKLSFLCLATTGDTAVSLGNNFDSNYEFIEDNETHSVTTIVIDCLFHFIKFNPFNSGGESAQ